MRRRQLLNIAFLLCAMLCAPASAGKKAPDKPAAEKAPDPIKEFLQADKLYPIHITLTPQAWRMMQPNRRPRAAGLDASTIPAPATQPVKKANAIIDDEPPHPKIPGKSAAVEGEKLGPNTFGYEFIYVKADIECDGEKLTDVALRFKGNASYDNYSNTPRRPYKLDFNRYKPGQRFKGMQTLNLSNNAFDFSLMRETLSYEVYRLAGVPSPRTALATVYLTVPGVFNSEYVGVFTLIEEMDEKEFLTENFKDPAGLVLKPEGTRGFPYMGENWQNYTDRYRPKGDNNPPALTRQFIEFVKLVNYADDTTFRKKIDGLLDVDSCLRYLAATVLISNLDSPLVTHHNYYLYVNPVNQKVHLLPWDMNLSFAGYSSPGSGENQINLNIAQPWAGDHKFFSRLLAVDEYKKQYRDHLRNFIDQFFNDKILGQRVEELSQVLLEGEEAQAAKPGKTSPNESLVSWGFSSRMPLQSFITRRAQSVLDQLDGKPVKTFIPISNFGQFAPRWGVRCDQVFGNLTLMSQDLRKRLDDNADYKISRRELHTAAAAFFYNLADEDKPDSISLTELAIAIDPFLLKFGGKSRGFLGMGKNAGTPGLIWSRAFFTQADANEDGRLTLMEILTCIDQSYCIADSDDSGKLSEIELIEALDNIAAPPTLQQSAR